MQYKLCFFFLTFELFFYSNVTDEYFADKTRVWYKYKISILVSVTSLFTGSLFTIPEGWGKSQEIYKSGQYRLFAWKSLKAKTHSVQKLYMPSSANTELRFSTGINYNQTYDIVQVMVRIID